MLRFFGETLRQSGILIISSTLVIWGLVFITGLGTCGTEGAYFTQAQGAPDYAGVFTAWCDLREAVPYVFGYMMAAKVGTGIVAELGAMRISDEIDALEVMGIDSMTMATVIVLVGCYYGYNASGGPVGVGTATAKSMVLNLVAVNLIGMLGSQVFWGANPRAPIGG